MPDVPEGYTVVQGENGALILRKKRQRNMQKLGIGGFKARRPRAPVKDKEEDAVDNYNTAEVTLQQLKVFPSRTKATILRRQRRHPMWIQMESAAEANPNGSRRGGRQRTNWPKRIRPTSRKRFSVAISCKRPVYSLVTLCPTTTRVRRPKAAAATRNVYISKLLPMYTVSARADIYT